jgi:inosine triphosphate pyrophosphatase
MTGTRTGARRRHVSMLQGHERFARAICVGAICTLHPGNQLNLLRSKWFMLALGAEQMHKMLAGFDDKSTTAVCTFAYSEGPGHEPIIFQGKTEVLPGSPPPAFLLTGYRGSLYLLEGRLFSVSVTDNQEMERLAYWLGWDSSFEYEGKTYAEMDKAEKNKISHRGKALEKLKEWLAKEV